MKRAFAPYASMVLGVTAGLTFSVIGFVNIFWGNDPFFGVLIFSASLIYYLPLINAVQKALGAKVTVTAKYILGFFMLWASLGVGELFDKVELMLSNFPYPNITGI
jgi:hypothetical protein